MNQYEITKLKTQLRKESEKLKQQREDRELTEAQLVKVQAQRDKYYGQLLIARQTMENIDNIVADNVREMRLRLQQENAESLQELQRLKDRIYEQKRLNQKLIEQNKNKESVISELSGKLREMWRKYKDPMMNVDVKQLAEQSTMTQHQFYKLTQKYNKLATDMDNILAENKILRKLHGVPENFGFDLEEIKVAERQELEDFKSQCRKLQAEIEQLEAERTQLRYRLRQYNTLYSNKGERYKDLTQQQFQLLDAYALNLKQGKVELPQIDKSQKEMEKEVLKLRAQIQILQSRQPILPRMPISGNGQTSVNDKVSGNQIRKIQDQIKSILEPFVQDIRKLNQNNLNSIIRNVQTLQSGQGESLQVGTHQGQIPFGNFRPPIPLPVSHNDWSKIKQGYSYTYSSKIPVEMKDLQSDVGFDTIRAKYQLAALQLQNIQSLKLLKEKHRIESQLTKELEDLRTKYRKCLAVQDDLFIRYFKEKQEVKQRVRGLQIEKNAIAADKDSYKAQLDVLNDAFASLNKNSALEKKLSDYAARLAIAEAEVVKFERKYQAIHYQQAALRDAYTRLEGKSADVQFSLKQRLLTARKNQKVLTSLMNQILQNNKESISSQVHNALRARNESLNDKSANFAFREAQLRLKINRLESIERQMNIKDEMIESLRESSLDFSLQLEIIRNRLSSVDISYRTYQENFKRLIEFINTNNISLMSYFKKFDRDNSGNLSRDQMQSALNTLGFKLSSSEMEILFSQFDLDGSGSLGYREFVRKLKRGGALTRSKQEEAVWRLFKAIKQANISIKKAFQMIDMDGSNAISKSQFENAMRKIGIQCNSDTVQYIFKLADGDMDGTISCTELQKIFFDVVKESAIEEKQISAADIDWKYLVVLKIEQCSEKFKMSLMETFKTLDNDGNACLSITEMSQFFTKSGIQLSRKDLMQFFDFLDRKKDGKIEYNQFLRVLAQAKKQKKRIERIKFVQRRAEQIRKENQIKNEGVQSNPRLPEQAGLKVRLMALETKQGNLIKKNEKMIKSLANKEQQIYDLERNIQQLEKTNSRIQDEFYREKQSNIILQQKMKRYIGDQKAKQIQGEINKLRIQSAELKSSIQTYKGLYEGLSDKNKADQLRVGKIQAERNKYYDLVKDLQSTSDQKADIAKLTIEIQYSKRNEEIVNKKYDKVVEDLRKIDQQNKKLSEESTDKELDFVNTHIFMKQKYNLQQRTIDQLSAKIFPTVSVNKIEEFIVRLREISNSKSQLELENQALRDKNFSLLLRNDYIENEKLHIQELQRKLRRTYNDDASVAVMDLTKKLSQYKMSELKSKRQANLLKEKEEYYMRVNNANTDTIKQLEQQLGKWEVKFNQREQFWRKRIADQVKVMQDLHKQATKAKEQERKAVTFFENKGKEVTTLDRKYEQIGEQRRNKLSTVLMAESSAGEDVLELKHQNHELQRQLIEKEKQIYKLKSAIQQILPNQSAIRVNDFGSQMGQITNSYDMQTDLTTSQLKSNARRFINNQKQQQGFYKQEAEKMAQAAQQSIDTLQRIIDDKNQQLKRKEKIIDELKKEYMRTQDENCIQIQKLNEEIRQLRSNRQVNNSLNQIMHKSTSKNFYQKTGDDKVNGLLKLVQQKEHQIKQWQNKYDRLYINKGKTGTTDSASSKMLERKLMQVQEDREAENKRYCEAQGRLKDKIKTLEKLSKEKDLKLGKLQKALMDIKNDVVNEKMSSTLNERQFEDEVSKMVVSMNRGSNPNESKMEATLQMAMQKIQEMTKKNKQYQMEIKRMKEASQHAMSRTMQRK